MSARLSSRILAAAALAGAFVTAALAAPAGTERKPQKPPRAAVQVVRATYDVFQNDAVTGHEEIVRTNYNDNTVTFDVVYELNPAPEVNARQEVEMVLREESYYPLSYHEDKNITQQGNLLSLSIDVEMLANVAVYSTSTPQQSGSRNIVVPIGTAFMATGVVYVYYPLLFWYDSERAGRQNFDVFDVSSGRLETVVVEQLAQDSVTVDGQDYVADVYLVERDRYNVNLFVDDDGRILRVDQNFMRFDLSGWSRQGGESGGAR